MNSFGGLKGKTIKEWKWDVVNVLCDLGLTYAEAVRQGIMTQEEIDFMVTDTMYSESLSVHDITREQDTCVLHLTDNLSFTRAIERQNA